MYAEELDADGALSPSTHRKKRSIRGSLAKLLALAVILGLLMDTAPASALSMPTASASNLGISQNSAYTVTFQVNQALAAGVGTITAEFPAGFGVSGVTPASFTIAATLGIGTSAFAATSASAVAIAGQKVTGTTPNAIGAGATVQLVIGVGAANNVTNVWIPGDYVLKVSTSAETTPVISAFFTLTASPGVVSGFNSAGVKLFENSGATAIAAALATAGVTRVVVGAGYYDEDVTMNAGETLEGEASAIIKDINNNGAGGSVTIATSTAAAPVVVENLEIQGSTATGGSVIVAAGAVSAQIINNVLGGRPGVDTVVIGAGTTAAPTTLNGNSITVASG